MGAGASASVSAAVDHAPIESLREGLKDMSATNRAKLAVALLGDPQIYQNQGPGSWQANAQEWSKMEQQYLNKDPMSSPILPVSQSAPPPMPMQSMSAMSMQSMAPKPSMAPMPMQPMQSPMAQQQPMRQSMANPAPSSFNITSMTPSPAPSKPQMVGTSPASQNFGVSNTGPGSGNYTKTPIECAADKATWVDRGQGKRVGKYNLRDVNDSVNDIAQGPEEKAIAGTSDNMFQEYTAHDDADIGEVLAQAIDNLNSTAFSLPFSVSIAFPGIQDTPLIGISQGFLDLSGYTREEIVGQNCRLLLKGVPDGEISRDVRQEARRYCKTAHLKGLTTMSHVLLLQRNCRKDGELFWNLFMMSTIPGPNKRNYIIGLQLDLGPSLPEMEDRANMETMFFKDHRENLMKVQHALMGNKPRRNPNQPMSAQEELEEGMGLAEDIQAWLSKASQRAGNFAKVGTLPWVVWPTCRNHALMNAGTCLLRLEADRVKQGAVAMSIFPAQERPDVRYFKIQIDDICPIWGVDCHKGALLPTMGFTLMTPEQIDAQGGIPADVGRIPESVIMNGDGGALSVVPDNEGMGEAVKQFADKKGICQFPYKIKSGDILECVWGKGWMRVETQGKVIWEVRDMVIFPPKSHQAYAFIDLAGACCRVSLVQ